jgi:hypothetical protein
VGKPDLYEAKLSRRAHNPQSGFHSSVSQWPHVQINPPLCSCFDSSAYLPNLLHHYTSSNVAGFGAQANRVDTFPVQIFELAWLDGDGISRQANACPELSSLVG